jgi:chaperone required for assembly of F1-ATPase
MTTLIICMVATTAATMLALFLATDRASRERAWRQIALERRWNAEHLGQRNPRGFR